ncbi:MAG: helix-turn-helix domain-containing protein [Ignavibacteriaceae bacterium]
MALADACDDEGYCWPSIPTLARKTSLYDRSVERILNHLMADGLLRVEPRYRQDGSPHLQRLPVFAHPGDTGVTTWWFQCHPNHDRTPQ